MTDDSLVHEPVYARLVWQWSWRGLTLVHLASAASVPLFLWPLLWFVQETLWPHISLLFVLPFSFASASFIIIVQYRHPLDAFSRALARLAEPDTLSPVQASATIPRAFCEANFR